ncbi:MAG: MFS transporter [Christensenellaceae bacterium]|nr:MFS transporter [Christensenellaceae bacterium]
MEKDNNIIKNKRFLIFRLASLIAAIGSGMTSFAIGIYIFQKTDSAFIKSMISLVAFLPTILSGPFAGTLADRFDRRKMMVLGDGLSSLGIMLILFSLYFADSNIMLIGCGVFVSALFSSMIEPAAKATVSDMLNEEEYTKASGLLQLAGAARFLISPIITSFVMARGGLEAVLYIDLFTIFSTIGAVIYISKGLKAKETPKNEAYTESLRQGFAAIKNNSGIKVLVLFLTLLTFMLGSIQELSTPLILSFTDAKTLSIMLTIAALGMVVSSLYLGMREIRGNKIKILSLSVFISGIGMVGFGAKEQVLLITLSGFVFFMTLPFMNSIADYLIRVNIPNSLQGRVFGIIGTISQLGYVFAYALSGFLADFIFRPLLQEGGALASSIGRIIGVGSGRGIGLYIILEGFMLMVLAVFLANNRDLHKLKREGNIQKD